MTESIFKRDDPKHQLLPRHKKQLLQDLAAYFWQQKIRQIAVEKLETWLEDWFVDHPKVKSSVEGKDYQVLENDLRNSTLLVRANQTQYRFAHTSI